MQRHFLNELHVRNIQSHSPITYSRPCVDESQAILVTMSKMIAKYII